MAHTPFRTISWSSAIRIFNLTFKLVRLCQVATYLDIHITLHVGLVRRFDNASEVLIGQTLKEIEEADDKEELAEEAHGESSTLTR